MLGAGPGLLGARKKTKAEAEQVAKEARRANSSPEALDHVRGRGQLPEQQRV